MKAIFPAIRIDSTEHLRPSILTFGKAYGLFEGPWLDYQISDVGVECGERTTGYACRGALHQRTWFHENNLQRECNRICIACSRPDFRLTGVRVREDLPQSLGILCRYSKVFSSQLCHSKRQSSRTSKRMAFIMMRAVGV